MPAYSITGVEVLDPSAAARYAEIANASVAQYGGRFLAVAAEPAVVEGEWPTQERIVLIEFPDRGRLEAWYDSPEYRSARAIAAHALRRRLLFVDGVASDSAQTVRRFYEALSTGDTSIADEVLTADWEDIPLPPGSQPGAEGFKQTVAYLRSVFPDLSVTIEDMVVSGDRVAVRSTVRGTHQGEFLGVAATGRPVEFAAFDIHRLEAGRIAQSWHLEDLFGIQKQIAATPVAA